MALYINFVFTFYLWVDLKVDQTDSEDLLAYFYNSFCKKAPPHPHFMSPHQETDDTQSDRGVTHSSPAGSQAGSQAAEHSQSHVSAGFPPDKAHVLGSVRPVGVNAGVTRTRLRDINQVKAICQPQERLGCRGR